MSEDGRWWCRCKCFKGWTKNGIMGKSNNSRLSLGKSRGRISNTWRGVNLSSRLESRIHKLTCGLNVIPLLIGMLLDPSSSGYQTTIRLMTLVHMNECWYAWRIQPANPSSWRTCCYPRHSSLKLSNAFWIEDSNSPVGSVAWGFCQPLAVFIILIHIISYHISIYIYICHVYPCFPSFPSPLLLHNHQP